MEKVTHNDLINGEWYWVKRPDRLTFVALEFEQADMIHIWRDSFRIDISHTIDEDDFERCEIRGPIEKPMESK